MEKDSELVNMMKWIRFFIIFSVFAFLMNCENFNTENLRKPKKERGNNPRAERELVTTEKIEELDIGELRERTVSGGKKYQNCTSHNSGVASLGLTRVGTGIKNCIGKAIDEQVAPICEHEEELNSYKCDRRDERCEDSLAEAKDSVEETKDIAIDQIYEIADIWDEYVQEIEEDIDTDHLEGKILKTFSNIELGGIVRFVERKAKSVCGIKLDFSKRRRRN